MNSVIKNTGSAETQPKTYVEPKTLAMRPDDWLCYLCLNKITSEKNRFYYNHQSEFDFTNPYGAHFHIITFSTATGCVASTEPTTEFTWFAGFAWSICLCRNCGVHLGWQYIGESIFYGLIREHMVLGASALN